MHSRQSDVIVSLFSRALNSKCSRDTVQPSTLECHLGQEHLVNKRKMCISFISLCSIRVQVCISCAFSGYIISQYISMLRRRTLTFTRRVTRKARFGYKTWRRTEAVTVKEALFKCLFNFFKRHFWTFSSALPFRKTPLRYFLGEANDQAQDRRKVIQATLQREHELAGRSPCRSGCSQRFADVPRRNRHDIFTGFVLFLSWIILSSYV